MTFTRENEIKSVRKARQCTACGTMISVGSPAVAWAGMWDGGFSSATFHLECRAAEIALNRLYDTYADEWISFSDMERDDWPWLLAEHPVVAARLGITAAKISSHMAEQERIRKAWVAARDSDSRPSGENSRSEVEGEARQSGGEAASPKV